LGRLDLAKEIERFISRNIRERTGKGPRLIKATVYKDSIKIEVYGFLTHMENHYIKVAGADALGLVRETRLKMLQPSKAHIGAALSNIVGAAVRLTEIDLDIENDSGFVRLKIE